jgi:ankyrin repeat protein
MGSLACVKQLLDARAEPNKVEIEGWSPLHWTAVNNHVRVCQLLLENGADPSLKDSRGLIPQDWAISRGNNEIVAMIRKYNSKTKTTPPWRRFLGHLHRNARAEPRPLRITPGSEFCERNHN